MHPLHYRELCYDATSTLTSTSCSSCYSSTTRARQDGTRVHVHAIRMGDPGDSPLPDGDDLTSGSLRGQVQTPQGQDHRRASHPGRAQGTAVRAHMAYSTRMFPFRRGCAPPVGPVAVRLPLGLAARASMCRCRSPSRAHPTRASPTALALGSASQQLTQCSTSKFKARSDGT